MKGFRPLTALATVAAALSLLLSLAAAAAWITSYGGSPRWRLIATAHSDDLTRVGGGRDTLLFATTASWSKAPNYGFWDAWWARSQLGRLTLLAQVIDYDGTVRQVHTSPPSLVVVPAGEARSPAVVFARAPESAGSLGFAWQSDAQGIEGDGASGGARAWMMTVPYWFLVLLGFPLPLLWLRARRRRKSPFIRTSV